MRWLLAAFTVGTLWEPVRAAADDGRCILQLNSLSLSSAMPGDTVELHGDFGAVQGEKIVVANGAPLSVVSWEPLAIRVRLAASMPAGEYMIGLYCRDLGKGPAGGSGFLPLRVMALTPASAGDSATAFPAPPLAAESPEPLFGWLAGAAVLGVVLLAALAFLTRRRPASPAPGVQQSWPDRVARDQQGWRGDVADEVQGWQGQVAGVPYTVDLLSDDVFTVEIDAGGALGGQLEINARSGQPGLPQDSRHRDLADLLALGANYIDIGFNTDRVAAEFPVSGPKLDRARAEQAVKLLIRLRQNSQ